MLNTVRQKRASGATRKQRKHEIVQCLTVFGLLAHPHRSVSQAKVADDEGTHGSRLCQALESLGPVFAAFGLYMSSRVDLLPMHDCLQLATIADQAEATPFVTVQAVLARELHCNLEEVYTRFANEPFVSRLLFQSHCAVLHSGQEVVVKVVHPTLAEQCVHDLELLTVLQPAFTRVEWSSLSFARVIADFRRFLLQHLDLLHEVTALEALARDVQEFPMLKVPMVYKNLCSAQVVTVERLDGVSLTEVLAAWESEEREEPGRRSVGIDKVDLARRLSMVWLRQALQGQQFPVECCPSDIVVLPTRQIAYTGGAFMSLPAEAQSNLWNYLLAVSVQDPDKACTCLLREMTVGKRAFKEEELRHRFRETVPFRDGGWSRRGDSNSLAEHLFIHWQLASQRGLLPHHHLLGFYRGLFQTAALSRRFAPSHDALLDGLQDMRTIGVLAQFSEIMGLSHLGEQADKYAAMIMTLPQQLDAVLTLMAAGQSWPPIQGAESAGQRRQKNSSAMVVILLLVLAAVVLLSQHSAMVAVAGSWIHQISAVVVVLLGVLLLRAVRHI